jgi:hypothetical protein
MAERQLSILKKNNEIESLCIEIIAWWLEETPPKVPITVLGHKRSEVLWLFVFSGTGA